MPGVKQNKFAGTIANSARAAQNDTQSFEELYRIKNAVGSNFNLPRRFRLGLRVAF